MGAILEGRWDCDACGRKGIRGGERICPSCARPRPQNVKFYLPHDAPKVTAAAALHEAKSGPDWYCEHCGAGNSALRTACKQCGAVKGSSPSHKITDYSVDQVPHSADEAPEPAQAKGQDHEAYWPALQLTATEREAGRTEFYTIVLTDKRGRDYPYKCRFEEWSAFQPAQSLKIEVKETGIAVTR